MLKNLKKNNAYIAMVFKTDIGPSIVTAIKENNYNKMDLI